MSVIDRVHKLFSVTTKQENVNVGKESVDINAMNVLEVSKEELLIVNHVENALIIGTLFLINLKVIYNHLIISELTSILIIHMTNNLKLILNLNLRKM